MQHIKWFGALGELLLAAFLRVGQRNEEQGWKFESRGGRVGEWVGVEWVVGQETNKQTNRNIEIVLKLKAKRQSETLGQQQERQPVSCNKVANVRQG